MRNRDPLSVLNQLAVSSSASANGTVGELPTIGRCHPTFQTIKSVVKMRPIFHHTDSKVRAHVTAGKGHAENRVGGW